MTIKSLRRLCSKCKQEHSRKGRYCFDCHAAYMRNWRKDNPLEGEAKKRGNARAYAKVYVRRGLIEKLPCQACGDPNSQMHHPDHELPRDVVWLCRPCHLVWHAHWRENVRRIFAKWLEMAQAKRAA